MIRIAIPFSLLVSVIAAQPLPGEGTRARLARAIKIIPVPHLVSEMPRPHPLPFGTMIDCMGSVEEPSQRPFAEPEEPGTARVGDLAALLRDITPLNWNDGNVNVDLVGNSLMVTGSPDQIHLVEQSLQKLSACLGEPFRLHAAAFSLEAQLELPTVATSYADVRGKLLEAGAKFEWEQSATASPGQLVQMGALTTRSYIGDIEVEIAQSSTFTNPVVRQSSVGCAIQVQAHPLVGSSDAVLLAQYASAMAVAPMREMNLGKDDAMSQIQVPRLAIDTGTLSGRVRNGGALLLLAQGKWAGRTFGLLLGVERAPVAADAERDLGLFSLGAFLSHGLRWSYSIPNHGSAELWTAPMMTGDLTPAIEPADAQTWSTLFNRALGDEQTTVGIDHQLALVQGSGAANAKASIARLIEQLQEQFFRTVEVDYRLDGAADRQGVSLQRLRAPLLLGRSHAMVHGVETTGVLDSEVEVAQKAGIYDPKVVRHFSGTVCRLTAYGQAPNEVGLMAHLDIVDTVADQVYSPTARKGLPIDQPAITRSGCRHEGKVPGDGKPIEFGDGPAVTVDDRALRSRPTLSVRPR